MFNPIKLEQLNLIPPKTGQKSAASGQFIANKT
jgi:hypothetical protein